MSGTLPASIANLQKLTFLDIRSTSFSGTIPASLLTSASSALYVNAAGSLVTNAASATPLGPNGGTVQATFCTGGALPAHCRQSAAAVDSGCPLRTGAADADSPAPCRTAPAGTPGSTGGCSSGTCISGPVPLNYCLCGAFSGYTCVEINPLMNSAAGKFLVSFYTATSYTGTTPYNVSWSCAGLPAATFTAVAENNVCVASDQGNGATISLTTPHSGAAARAVAAAALTLALAAAAVLA